MKRLTRSETNERHPANQFWLLIALLRLGLRRGPEQLKLLMERK